MLNSHGMASGHQGNQAGGKRTGRGKGFPVSVLATVESGKHGKVEVLDGAFGAGQTRMSRDRQIILASRCGLVVRCAHYGVHRLYLYRYKVEKRIWVPGAA